jgi:hypothetical protein
MRESLISSGPGAANAQKKDFSKCEDWAESKRMMEAFVGLAKRGRENIRH